MAIEKYQAQKILRQGVAVRLLKNVRRYEYWEKSAGSRWNNQVPRGFSETGLPGSAIHPNRCEHKLHYQVMYALR